MPDLHKQYYGMEEDYTALNYCNRLSESSTTSSILSIPDFESALEDKVTNKLSTAFQSLILRQTTDYESS